MNLLDSSQRLFQSGLDLLFPPSCSYCKTSGSWLCSNCYQTVPLINAPICQRCGMPSTNRESSNGCSQCKNNPLQSIDGLRAAAYFEDNPIRSTIHALKYNGRKVVADDLALFLAEAYKRFRLNADVIVPVPLHPAKLKQRGFNQSELISHRLSRLIEIPVKTDILIRTRETDSQMELSASERHLNVANAFKCIETLQNSTVLLIDDVCTTGATLDNCAMALKINGAMAVWGLTLAKAR